MPTRNAARQLLVFSTCPNLAVARRIATALVRERLAACVSLVPRVQSIYRWKGKVESAKEVWLVIKVRRVDRRRVEARIVALHPYELPEVVSVGIAGGYARYLAWIDNPDKVK